MHKSICALLCLVALNLLISAVSARAAEISYSNDVLPILAKRCFACHGPDRSEHGLALHEADRALVATDSGVAAIVPGHPEQSPLVDRIQAADLHERMPPEGEALTGSEVETLRQWIAEGAEYETHWAFRQRQHWTPPDVASSSWVRNPIDRFILARLEANGLQPAPEASKSTLVRRLYYDVVGMPPTPEDVAAFVADQRPDSYERLVDRLLASPHYGEKWARHWLDVVCYGETNSYERDAPKPNAYKYRDWVIRSLNADKPYDQFVREQLAGDELDEVTADTMIATGYYRLGVWDDAPVDKMQAEYDERDIILTTTGHAFLGLTIGCARCHDHKIDPIPQTDYYQLLAFFADVTRYRSGKSKTANHQWDMSSPAIKTRRRELTDLRDEIEHRRTELEQQAIRRMEGVDQRRTETKKREKVLAEKLDQHQTAPEREEYHQLGEELSGVESALDGLPDPEFALALARCDPHPPAVHVLERGNVHAPGQPVEPRFPQLFGGKKPELPEVAPDARSAGRRRLFAEWVMSPDNMLTSRVIANRVWQHHFGRGIVRSSNNFGRLGTPPTHPKLLDWLAEWLVEHDWRLKGLHRLILTSSVYRMSSAPDAEALVIDPTNDLFWRYDMRRLTAEELRDSVLAVSGKLDRSLYGPSIYPKLSDEVLATQSKPGHGWDTSHEAGAPRRSIYIHIKRTLLPPELEVFDFPQPDTSCAVRFNTTQPAQALNLLHGDFLQSHAGFLAERVMREADRGLEDQVAHALRLVLQREADDAMMADSLALVGRFQTKHGLSSSEAFPAILFDGLQLKRIRVRGLIGRQDGP